MPVIFSPVLYVIGTNRISNRMNRNAYNTIVVSISGLSCSSILVICCLDGISWLISGDH